MSLKRFRPAFKENGVIGRYKREESLFYIYIYICFFLLFFKSFWLHSKTSIQLWRGEQSRGYGRNKGEI